MTVTQTSRAGRTGTPSAGESDDDLFSLDTPVVSFHVHRPHMPRMPRMMGRTRGRGQEMNRAMETARTFLPPPERIAYYGGLGLLAAVGLMEWPVAAAIGAGTLIAQRACASAARESAEETPQPGERPASRTTTARASRAAKPAGRTSRTTSRASTSSARTTARASRTTGATASRRTAPGRTQSTTGRRSSA